MSVSRQIAIVTGASTGIGLELAKCCAQNNFDLLIAADEPQIEAAAASIRGLGAAVEAVEAGLSTLEGVDRLYEASKRIGRPSMRCSPMRGGDLAVPSSIRASGKYGR